MDTPTTPHPDLPKVNLTYDYRITVDFPAYVTHEAAQDGIDFYDPRIAPGLTEAVFTAIVEDHDAGHMAECLRQDLLAALDHLLGPEGVTVKTVDWDTEWQER